MELIVFDMGHVLVDFDWQQICLGFCEHAAITFDEFKPILKRLSKLGYEKGDIETRDFLARINDELRVITTKSDGSWRSISLEQFDKMWNATFEENQEMAMLLQRLRQSVPLALLSNTNEIHFNWVESNFKITRHFQKVFLSYKLKCQKPDAKIYQLVLEETGLRPEQVVFVDDRAENVEAACALGMQGLQFHNAQLLKSHLNDLGFMLD